MLIGSWLMAARCSLLRPSAEEPRLPSTAQRRDPVASSSARPFVLGMEGSKQPSRHALGCLQKRARITGVDQQRRAGEQHLRVYSHLTGRLGAVLRGPRRARDGVDRAAGLSNDERHRGADRARFILELANPDHPIDDQDRQEQHEHPPPQRSR